MDPRPPFRLTLIEILILLVIAATLATIVVPRLVSHHAAVPSGAATEPHDTAG